MEKKITGLVAILILLFLSIMACQSILPAKMEDLSVSGSAENEVCDVYVMSVDRDTLYERFGKTNNPFIAPPMLITPRYFYVFSVTVTAKQNVTVQTDRIELIAGGDREHPDGVEAVIRFWEANSPDDTPTDHKNILKKKGIMRKNLFPDSLSLIPGESYTGYIMFIHPNPSLNPGQMIIPAGSPLLITF